MDYNNYKCSGTYLANYAGSNNADLAAWQTLSSKDATSISADPVFASATDFHLGSSSPLINKAIPIFSIITDIDGDPRDPSTPDIGADVYPSPLPVTYATLSAKKNSEGNLLSWKTYTESNNLGFELQRSYDGYNYTAIAFVNTKANNGNSSIPLLYEYTDRKPDGAKQYYRLLQKDANGNGKLSNVVVLSVNQSAGLLGTYPNPVVSALFLQLYSEKNTNAKLLVMDASGKPVIQQNTRLEQGSNTSSIYVAALPKGYYNLVITIEGTDKTFSAKFIKQ